MKHIQMVNGPEPVDYQLSVLDYEHYSTHQIQPITKGILPFIGDNFATLLTGQLGLSRRVTKPPPSSTIAPFPLLDPFNIIIIDLPVWQRGRMFSITGASPESDEYCL